MDKPKMADDLCCIQCPCRSECFIQEMWSLQGNVQVYHDGVWGGICDDEWGEAEAEIACKELGFSRGAVGPTHSSQFGYSPRIIWMDNGRVANACLSRTQPFLI